MQYSLKVPAEQQPYQSKSQQDCKSFKQCRGCKNLGSVSCVHPTVPAQRLLKHSKEPQSGSHGMVPSSQEMFLRGPGGLCPVTLCVTALIKGEPCHSREAKSPSAIFYGSLECLDAVLGTPRSSSCLAWSVRQEMRSFQEHNFPSPLSLCDADKCRPLSRKHSPKCGFYFFLFRNSNSFRFQPGLNEC